MLQITYFVQFSLVLDQSRDYKNGFQSKKFWFFCLRSVIILFVVLQKKSEFFFHYFLCHWSDYLQNFAALELLL